MVNQTREEAMSTLRKTPWKSSTILMIFITIFSFFFLYRFIGHEGAFYFLLVVVLTYISVNFYNYQEYRDFQRKVEIIKYWFSLLEQQPLQAENRRNFEEIKNSYFSIEEEHSSDTEVTSQLEREIDPIYKRLKEMVRSL